MLIKRSEKAVSRGSRADMLSNPPPSGLDRRSFLRRSGLTTGALAALGSLPLTTMRKAQAGPPPEQGLPVEMRKSICTHCSVGCTVTAEVQNGLWIGQEPSWDSPINRGSHCSKGASVRELVQGERRLKYPMKLVDGRWVRVSWDQAIGEIGDKLLSIREKSGPDSVYWLGSAKFSNETAYLFRKFAAFWGSNNVDHQARICHSTTVAGVANTWGYGAMTNSYNDIRNSKTLLIMGANPAEAHPVSLQHLLEGKELNRANMIVIDPRMTRTAAHATEYVRIRPGTDIPVLYGLMWHIFKNGWQNDDFIRERVYGIEKIKEEVAKWTPEEVERVSGVPGEQLENVARKFATEKPATLIWCMGQTQHTVGTANVRASCILLLITGNVGAIGNGANIFRGHDNVQGATDVGLDCTTLPFYYGLDENAWRHWSRVWDVDYEWVQKRFVSKKLMESAGIPSTRWFDATLLAKDQIVQEDNLRAMVIFGHAGNTVTRMPEAAKGIEALDLLVVVDTVPTTWSVLSERKNGTYLLPSGTAFETEGSRTASNRSLQWYDRIVDPIFEAKADAEITYRFAKKFGFADELCKHVAVKDNLPVAEDLLREINRGGWSTGYSGQSPERLKLHRDHQHDFDLVTLRASDGPCKGDYYGLPWPCWGTPEYKHPGTPILYNISLHVKEGGGTFRARFGVEHDGASLLADGSYSKGSDIKDGYPEFTMAVLKKLGWDKDLTADELATIQTIGGTTIDKVSWSTDLSGGIQRVALEHGCIPHGNGKARAIAWNLPDPVPVHREPIYTPRVDLVGKYPTLPDMTQFRVPNLGLSVQKSAIDRGIAKQFPLILSSGRLVDYEGGGEETRANKWLAELRQDMYIEINPGDAQSRGIRDNGWVWVMGAENQSKAKMKARVTERVGKGVAWMPYHFAGWFQGVDQRSKYPVGADPYVLGESANGITTYGYDPVTNMQEPKVTLCQIVAA